MSIGEEHDPMSQGSVGTIDRWERDFPEKSFFLSGTFGEGPLLLGLGCGLVLQRVSFPIDSFVKAVQVQSLQHDLESAYQFSFLSFPSA
ncbi:hypothetical protein R1flu_013140 [Riccia fluitans]|uniref:Uncharacterized protein n=1 Tax=Riccia fluitans TaxID=41844 RepID=A0ABD1XEE4_9MARC